MEHNGDDSLKSCQCQSRSHRSICETKEETIQLQRECLFQATVSSKATKSQLCQNKNSKYFSRLLNSHSIKYVT